MDFTGPLPPTFHSHFIAETKVFMVSGRRSDLRLDLGGFIINWKGNSSTTPGASFLKAQLSGSPCQAEEQPPGNTGWGELMPKGEPGAERVPGASVKFRLSRLC